MRVAPEFKVGIMTSMRGRPVVVTTVVGSGTPRGTGPSEYGLDRLPGPRGALSTQRPQRIDYSKTVGVDGTQDVLMIVD